MRHLRDDDLVLHYYGEDGSALVGVEAHLRSCDRCAAEYAALARTLDAVVPPTFTGGAISAGSIQEMLRDHLRHSTRADAGRDTRHEVWLAAPAWLFALLYPLSLRALFAAGQWSDAHTALVPLVPAALLWSCAGPLLAAMTLQRMATRAVRRLTGRLIIVGALLAATAPASFVLARLVAARVTAGSEPVSWFALLGVGVLTAVLPWPAVSLSALRTRSTHRTAAVVLMAFLFGHVVNQALAFVSPPSYTAMRAVMRLASVNPISYTAILVLLTMLIGTGVVGSMKNVGPGSLGRNLQATSGWYLAAFLLMHVFSGLFLSTPATTVAPPVDPSRFNLLASSRAVSQLPFLLLGVSAFLFHVGVYARLVALAYAADVSVRRWSYAGAAAAAAVVGMVGLSLCGVHL